MIALARIENFCPKRKQNVFLSLIRCRHSNTILLYGCFVVKLGTNPFAKSHKRTLRLIYDTGDVTFEDLLETDKSRTIHEGNTYTLLVEIYKSADYVRLPIMGNFLDLKRNSYNLHGNYLLKLPDTSTYRYGTQVLCFKGRLLWNKIANRYKNLNSLEKFKFKIQKFKIKQWNPNICRICK